MQTIQQRRGEGNGLRNRRRKLAAPQRGAKWNGTAGWAGFFFSETSGFGSDLFDFY